MISSIITDYQCGKVSKEDIAVINKNFGDDFLKNTMQGYALEKPFGYAGDFLMIDKIYKKYTSPIEEYKVWDEFFHSQSAPKAVRNRKKYFKTVVHKSIKNHGTIDLMNIASGPARDLLEVYLEDKTKLNSLCIDADENAIAYAKDLNKDYLTEIDFVHKNILRFQTDKKFNLIWSAGLFDYFDDKVFIHLLKRMKQWMKPKGEIVIGNFNEDHNPSRTYMELFGEWYLNHRTEKHLTDLANEAGFLTSKIRIGREEENVNLFLHLTNQ